MTRLLLVILPSEQPMKKFTKLLKAVGKSIANDLKNSDAFQDLKTYAAEKIGSLGEKLIALQSKVNSKATAETQQEDAPQPHGHSNGDKNKQFTAAECEIAGEYGSVALLGVHPLDTMDGLVPGQG